MTSEEQRHLHDLLVRTSRTFAISIPVLPEPTRLEVTVAYLLFRIADTLEDAVLWARPRKLTELNRFAELLAAPDLDEAGVIAGAWTADPPLRHDGYVELLAELPLVLRATMGLNETARRHVITHTRRTIDGMSTFVAREREGNLQLDDLDDLKAYCYAVAGIVGEMLTELFVLGRDELRDAADALRRDAATFGEALQLVNILKDSASDAKEGRRYLPPGLDGATVLELARADLQIAGGYSMKLALAGAPRGVVEFTLLPILLAWATLEKVEKEGPGAKVSRRHVESTIALMKDALDRRDPGALARIFPIDNDERGAIDSAPAR